MLEGFALLISFFSINSSISVFGFSLVLLVDLSDAIVVIASFFVRQPS